MIYHFFTARDTVIWDVILMFIGYKEVIYTDVKSIALYFL